MYRFLVTPRWLGYAALTIAMAAVMVLLGFWQLDRYRERSAINDRIDATTHAEPRPLHDVLDRPPADGAGRPGRVGPAPTADEAWTRVTVAGRYDTGHEILVRGRTVADRVGFEVVTPLVLDDGSAVLVDRGWIAPAEGGAGAVPDVPPAPGGRVQVTGRVRAPESRADAVRVREGRLEARRIAPRRAAAVVPYPLYGGYITVQSQVPPVDERFVETSPPRENALQNGGYVLQWWLFAALTIVGFGYVARRQARGDTGIDTDRLGPVGDRLDTDRLDTDRLDARGDRRNADQAELCNADQADRRNADQADQPDVEVEGDRERSGA